MSVYITKKIDIDDLVQAIKEAAYSGTRILVQSEEGVQVGIVPREDLELLEQVDNH